MRREEVLRHHWFFSQEVGKEEALAYCSLPKGNTGGVIILRTGFVIRYTFKIPEGKTLPVF